MEHPWRKKRKIELASRYTKPSTFQPARGIPRPPPGPPPTPSTQSKRPTSRSLPDNPYLLLDDEEYDVEEDGEEEEREEPIDDGAQLDDVEADVDDPDLEIGGDDEFETDLEFDDPNSNECVDAEHELKRDELQVSVEGIDTDAFPPVADFRDLDGVPEYIFESLEKHKLYSPLPIQQHALPIALEGHDIIGIAKTGSGKTLAFLIPAIVHVETKPKLRRYVAAPIVLVLAPTRELAQQIKDQASKLLEFSAEGGQSRGSERGIFVQEVYGGKQSQIQVEQSKGCAIIVATPGRLCDFLDRGAITLKRVSYFVLDEADRMLDFGFQDDVQNFAKHIPADRQMLFFSATWPPSVQDLATSLCAGGQEPVMIRVGQQGEAPTTRNDIIQEVIVFDQPTWAERDAAKQKVLYAHLRKQLRDRSNKVLVFVSNKGLADELRDKLSQEGFSTDSMHGGKAQSVRDHALEQFKTGATRLLVATDVIGRGLDIPTITHVVIYDMGDIDDYVHRIGRTARGITDRKGHALTLFEYDQKWSELAGCLVQVLIDSEQPVPEDLQRIADEVESGERVAVERAFKVKTKKKNKAAWVEAEDPKKDEWNTGSWKKYGNKKNYKNPKEMGVMCQRYADGHCKWGEQCAFSHGI